MNKNSGFTLVELVGSLVIICILAAASAPYLLSKVYDYRVNGASRQVLGDMRLARTTAINKGCTVFMKFHKPVYNGYTIYLDTNKNFTLDSAGDEAIAEVNLDEMYKGITLNSNSVSDSVTFHDNRARFKPLGKTSTGEVYLIPSVDFGVARNDRQRRVTLQGSTGRAKVEAWTNSGWN